MLSCACVILYIVLSGIGSVCVCVRVCACVFVLHLHDRISRHEQRSRRWKSGESGKRRR